MVAPGKLVHQSSLIERPASPCVHAERSLAAACGHSKRRIAMALAVLLCAMIASSPETLFAQTPTPNPTAPPAPPAEPDSVTRGGTRFTPQSN